jgi:trimeric autotransporter adhesin
LPPAKLRIAALATLAITACNATQSAPPTLTTPPHNANLYHTASGKNFPPGFWDASHIPPAHNVMMFKFLNRTNGKFPDSKVFWSVSINGVTQTHSIAAQPLFDMPANSSGRIYFYLGRVGTNPNDYYDFIEYTIGPAQFNGNTTRVDAFGIKVAIRLHCHDGYTTTVGENAAAFAEDRKTTFARFAAAVPAPFKQLAKIQAPYRIPSPGNGGFGTGGAYATYYSAYEAQVWSTNGLTLPTPGPDADGLADYPDLSAAIYRHTAGPGTFSPSGQLRKQSMWTHSSTFYRSAPADYYAQFWHENAIDGKAYGFPYDDVGGYSSYISHSDPTYMLVAIGW